MNERFVFTRHATAKSGRPVAGGRLMPSAFLAVALAACLTWSCGSDPAEPSCTPAPAVSGVFIDAIFENVLVAGDRYAEAYAFTSNTQCPGCSLAGLRQSFLAGYRQEISVTACAGEGATAREAAAITLTRTLPPEPVTWTEAVISGHCGTHKDYCLKVADVSLLWVLPSTTIDPSGDYTSLSALPATGRPLACAEVEGFAMDDHSYQASRIKLRKAKDGELSCAR